MHLYYIIHDRYAYRDLCDGYKWWGLNDALEERFRVLMNITRRAIISGLAAAVGVASQAKARIFRPRGGVVSTPPTPPPGGTGGAISFQTANQFRTADLWQGITISPTGPFTSTVYIKPWTSNAVGGVLFVTIIGDAVSGTTYGDDLSSVTFNGIALTLTAKTNNTNGHWCYLYHLL